MNLDDHELAGHLASHAGARLLEIRERHGFADPAALRSAGDRTSHEVLVAELAKRCPDDAVLSEEGAADPRRRTAERVWIVDPLDGTREFGEAGRDDWAVHVALWQQGELVAGAVAMPARDLTLTTASPQRPGAARPGGRLSIAVSRTRPPVFVNRLAEALDAETTPMGSAGVKIASVILGEVEVYVHAGGQYEWDSAAPVAVARAAGLHTSRLDGSPLTYNRDDPRLPDLLVCRPDLATRLLAGIEGVSRAEVPNP